MKLLITVENDEQQVKEFMNYYNEYGGFVADSDEYTLLTISELKIVDQTDLDRLLRISELLGED